MHAFGHNELPVNVPELPTGVAQEEPSRDAVIGSEERDEHQQRAGRDDGAVVPEERHLVRREDGQLAGQPGGQQEDGQRSQKGGVLDHRRASSNAWSTRMYVTWRPSGFTRTNSFGTWSRITKSICAM